MNEAGKDDPFQRILVGVDASAGSFSALEAAAALAAELHSELIGLFVEDDDLLSLAGLPFSQEVTMSGSVRSLDPTQIEQEMKRRATAARRALRSVAEQRRLRWNFQVVRGRVTRELTAAAHSMDLLCVGPCARPATRRGGRGETARLVSQARGAVLYLERHAESRSKPVMALLNGGAYDRDAVEICNRVAGARGSDVALVIQAEDESQAGEILDMARQRLGNARNVTVRTIVPPDRQAILRLVGAAETGLLVTAADADLATEEGLNAVIETADCPVLVLGSRE